MIRQFFKFSILFGFWLLPALGQKIYVASVHGSINPSTASYIHETLKKAEAAEAECIIFKLNTPGGLLTSTREIVSDFLEAKIPVIVYVSPGGAQAASAGVFITMAAHVAAMSPGTNIGAASPVAMQGQMDSIMLHKAMNDAAAFIRSIAEKRNRNVAWAEDAVRNAVAITENEAVDKKVVELVCKGLDDLLYQLDGRVVEVDDKDRTLHTVDTEIVIVDMNWTERFFNVLSDPNIAYILFLLGVYGLLFEIYNPGSILPGVVGGICIILAFYSLHTLPINYAGVGLILFAIILFIAEIKVTSYGLLSVGGVISLVLGSMMLIRSDSLLEFMEISLTVIITSAILTVAFFTFVIGLGIKAQTLKVTTGVEGMIGEIGETITQLNPEGKVRTHGEIWQSISESGTIPKGAKVKVSRIENLTLYVEKNS